MPEVKGFARPAHGSLAQVAVQPPDGVPPLLSVMHVHGSVELRVGRKAQNCLPYVAGEQQRVVACQREVSMEARKKTSQAKRWAGG